MNRWVSILFFLLMITGHFTYSQGNRFALPSNMDSDKIPFQLINNLIIIPVEVNNVELSFILDSGVNKPILFNILDGFDIIDEQTKETIYLKGLGEGEVVEAVKSKNNIFKIGDAVKFNQTIYAVYNTGLDYAPKLGMPIHGIIGYDLFKDFVVEINYAKKHLKIIKHADYKERLCNKCEKHSLRFFNNKPYLKAEVTLEDKNIPINVLIDTGASDALWLFEDESKDIVSTDNYFEDFLGYGLSGSLYGKRSKVESLSIGAFQFNESLVAFPEGSSIETLRRIKDRNGTVGAEILKRFNITFNYKEESVILKKNNFFRKEFKYNKSGIDLEHNGFRVVKDYYYTLDNGRLHFNIDVSEYITNIPSSENYRLDVKPAFQVVKLRENSPAKNIGIELGDIILEVNGKDVKDYTLQHVIDILSGKDGKKIRLLIERQNKIFEYKFQLKDMLK
ncbi:PDZ domain-containing protein [Hanstruepera ponticola]|uniref:PDZ domain-containing protein n=1 Tax=Hanstruepera ponticola TaxID=2042995 RepID=UPI00178244CD|nr:PDZ domain-containing protein [Hanstruepera ponticola]